MPKTMMQFLAIFLLLSGIASAQDKPAKSYPEHGAVVAVRVGGPTKNVRYSLEYPTHVYRIETPGQFYELMDKGKKPSLAIGDSVDFRVEKENAYLRESAKEKKYDIIDLENKTTSQKP